MTYNVRAVGVVSPMHFSAYWGNDTNREVGSCRGSDKSRLCGETARTLGARSAADCAQRFADCCREGSIALLYE